MALTLQEALEQLLDCMCNALGAAGFEGECCVQAGAPIINLCSGKKCGQAWARLVRAYPSRQFPLEDGGASEDDCYSANQWALVIDVGAVTCVCAAECSCEQKAADAEKILKYAEAALAGVNCCFTNGVCKGVEYRVGNLQMVGPDGTCGGFRMEVTRAYSMPCCPPESESPGEES